MASTRLSAALRQSTRCTGRDSGYLLFSSQSLPRCRFASTAATKDTLPPGVIKERRRVTKHLAKARQAPSELMESDGIDVVADGEQKSKVHLPPISTWRRVFRITKEVGKRVSMRNPATCRKLAEAYVPEGSKDRVVIEASPGPGQLTRALLNLPRERIRKLIVLEPVSQYLDWLKPLEEVDDRLKVLPFNGHSWSSYTKINDMGLLNDVETVEWKDPHPQLTFIMTMPPFVDGEQLVAQLLRTIPDRQWLQQYGRVPMHFLLTSRMWERLKAPAGTMARCKVSVMAQAAADMTESIPFDDLQPYADHFHPERHNTYDLKYGDLDLRRLGIPYASASVMPLAHPYIEPGDLDYWDYCARKLFVQKATAIQKCIIALGPGAINLLDKLSSEGEYKLDLKKIPRDFDIQDWAKVVKVFKEWPFRPEDLGIDTVHMVHQHNR